MPKSESQIEKEVCQYAESLGWLVYKFVSTAQRGVPDRMFMRDGVVFFIEFKAPGKRASAMQVLHMKKIKDRGGIQSFVVDDVTKGKTLINSFGRGKKI